ncbi:MAG: hypothetical protein V3S48_05405 [Candidatus Neomarinimicrobiota bacterium]
MDLTNKTELELYFSNHFGTVLFPVLAEMYQSTGDYIRAKKVCEIGLKYLPDLTEGQFIMAKAELGLGKLSQTEKWLKLVLKKVPGHNQATATLPMVQEQLGRSAVTLTESWKRLLLIDPENELAQKFLKGIKTSKAKLPKNKKTKSPKVSIKIPIQEITLEGVKINPRLATFTFVAVLRNQGLFHQALDVLDILEKKGADKSRVALERKRIQSEIEP